MAVDTISVLGTAITAYSFLETLFSGEKSEGASVKIWTSKGVNMFTKEREYFNTGGRVRNVYGYDAAGVLLGDSGGHDIAALDQHVFQIRQGNQDQALYVDVVADDDALCIPLISVTQPGGGAHYGWIGDVFKGCGLDNYYGNVAVDGNHMPACGWIDANHEAADQASFKWYLPAFSVNHGDTSYSRDQNYYCHPRPFEVRYDAQPIESRSLEARHARHERIRRSFKVKELILSPHAQHLASSLCEDDNSVGPDFISLHEGTFCDMENKKWYSLCNDDLGILDNCFALDVANNTMSGIFSHPKALGLSNTLTSYDRMVKWD